MSSRITNHIRSNVIGYVALFLALTGGVAWANHPGGANTISSGDIIDGEVKSADIGNGEVKNGDLGADSVGSGKIVDQSVKNADLGTGASSSNTIADGGIQGIDVKNNTLTGAQIDESTLAGLWKLGGNAGTGAGDFLGTTDNQPLNLRVNAARGLRLDPASDGTNQSPNVIGGISDNSVTAGVHSATIGGGGRGTPSNPASANRVTDHQGVVGGGANNQAGDGAGTAGDRTLATVGGGGNNNASGEAATVGGGFFNTASGSRATVGGGQSNNSSTFAATVGGGDNNRASGSQATVGGGTGNTAGGGWGTVGGGTGNSASGDWATAGGGSINTASGPMATVGGGQSNDSSTFAATVGGGDNNRASGVNATVGGGRSNNSSSFLATVGGGGNNTASGERATVLGGQFNTALGHFSLAGGLRAQANHQGAFVWADSNQFDFASTAQNQFSVRSTGGARFVSAVDGTGNPTAGVELAPGGGSWSSLSDAASKRAVEPVSGLEVLRELDSVPISTWSYRSQDDSVRHIGPMAQDFFRAFGVGEDRRHIASVDADGVALAAIKGLSRTLRAERRRRHELEARVAALERGRR